jgi:tyrosine-specific transport protein
MKIKEVEATAILVGTVIGAGILGMPYVIVKAGFLLGLVYTIGIGLILLLLNLYVGEICLRTKGTHMFSGYAERYLGKGGRNIFAFIMTVSIIGALIAYLIGIGEAAAAIFGGSPLLFTLLFFVLASVLVFFDLGAIEESELAMTGIMLVVVAVIIAFALPNAKLSNFSGINWKYALLPYGVVLFAYLGSTAIPEMKKELEKDKKKLKKAIIIGSIIPIAVYVLFVAAVVGVTGFSTTEIATIGLGNKLGRSVMLLGNAFAIFAMATTFFTLALALKWILHYDYKVAKDVSWAFACFVPLTIFLAGARSFIRMLELTGAVAGGLQLIFIIVLAMAAKRKGERKPEYSLPLSWIIAALLIAFFAFGIIQIFF